MQGWVIQRYILSVRLIKSKLNRLFSSAHHVIHTNKLFDCFKQVIPPDAFEALFALVFWTKQYSV